MSTKFDNILPEDLPEFQYLSESIDSKIAPYWPMFRFFRQSPYSRASTNHRILYGICYSRICYSAKTNLKHKEKGFKEPYRDTEGHVFCVLTRPQVQAELGLTPKTITELFQDLEKAGLIKRVKQGYNSYHIYVCVPPKINEEAIDSKTQTQGQEAPSLSGLPKEGEEDFPEEPFHDPGEDEIPF